MRYGRRRTQQAPHEIVLKWGGKCSLCGCVLAVGSPAIYVPAQPGAKPTVQHRPEDSCGMAYTVDAVYHASRKSFQFNAYSAADALSMAVKAANKGNPIAKPVEYVVWQGNVVVLREAA